MAKMDKLWQQFKQNMDSDARQQIILAYAYLAKYVVDRMNLRPSPVMSHDDLVSHAVMGLIDAVEKFELEKGVKFETYATVRIRGAVLDALKALDWMPRSLRSSEHELKQVFARLEAELGRAATDKEVANALGIDVDALDDMLANIGQSAVMSLEELMVYGEEGESYLSFGNQTHPENDPVTAAVYTERRRLLADAITALPEKEKLVISLYYKDGLTLKEIAAVLGVTESRACQLHSKAVVRMHGKLARHQELLLTAA